VSAALVPLTRNEVIASWPVPGSSRTFCAALPDGAPNAPFRVGSPRNRACSATYPRHARDGNDARRGPTSPQHFRSVLRRWPTQRRRIERDAMNDRCISIAAHEVALVRRHESGSTCPTLARQTLRRRPLLVARKRMKERRRPYAGWPLLCVRSATSKLRINDSFAKCPGVAPPRGPLINFGEFEVPETSPLAGNARRLSSIDGVLTTPVIGDVVNRDQASEMLEPPHLTLISTLKRRAYTVASNRT